MNKLFPLLAFAAFALVACSEDKLEPTQTEICAKRPITKECLIGKWDLKSVDVKGVSGCNPADGDKLELEKNGRFTFYFTRRDGVQLEKNGIWALQDGGMIITFENGDYNYDGINPIDARIDIGTGPELKITTTNYSGFLQCNASATFTEIFAWRGKIK